MNDNLGSRSSGRSLRDIARVNYKSLHHSDYCLGDMSGNDDTEKEETVSVTKETIAVTGRSDAEKLVHSVFIKQVEEYVIFANVSKSSNRS